MKNRYIKIIIGLVIVLLLSLSFNKIVSVKADSGWDTDYDSSSSWDYGSSWDSDFSWDYGSSRDSDFSWDYGSDSSSSSRRNNNGSNWSLDADKASKDKEKSKNAAYVVLVLIIGIPTLYLAFKAAYNPNKPKEANSKSSKINVPELGIKAYQIFYIVQTSYMNFNYEKLRKLLSDELYNSYIASLEDLKSKNQRNIMKNFELINTKLNHVNKKDDKFIVELSLDVKFIDYIEDINTNEVLSGNSSVKVHNNYDLTLEGLINKKDICIKCGAPILENKTGICEYCKSKLDNEAYAWIISNIDKKN